MSKFKRVFYPIYLIFALGFLYLSFDSLLNMERMLAWFHQQFSLESQPFIIMTFLLLLVLMMLIEIIVENIHIHRLKNRLPDLEDQITKLKARLYDQEDQDDGEEDDDDENDDDK